MSPWGFTLRDLVCMVEGHQRFQWRHTSELIARVGNMLGAKVKPADFDPFELNSLRSEPTAEEARQGWADLKAAFMGSAG